MPVSSSRSPSRQRMTDRPFRPTTLPAMPRAVVISRTDCMQSVLLITTARGMAGKVVGRNGLSVIRWRLGERELDTGIRFHTRDDHNEFLTRSTTIHQENS